MAVFLKFVVAAMLCCAHTATLISDQPNTPVHMEDGLERYFPIPNLYPEGLAIRVLKSGVSAYSLFGLPPIDPNQFNLVIRTLATSRGMTGSDSAPPPRIHAPDVKRGYGIWIVECLNEEGETFATSIMLAFDDLESRAVFHCERVRYVWNSVEKVLVPTSSQFGGFRSFFSGMDSYEFATFPNSEFLLDRMTSIIY